MSKLAIGRIAGILIAITSAIGAVGLTQYAMAYHAKYQSWIVDRPMHLAVDLSEPGEWTVPFKQICTVGHSEDIFLQMRPIPDTEVAVEEALADLMGSVSIYDETGGEVASASIDGSDASRWGASHDIRLSGLVPFATGEYMARITIEQGVTALANTEQTIYAAYDLCGLELLPAQMAALSAFALMIVGLIAAVCVVPGLIRYGLRVDQESKPLNPST